MTASVEAAGLATDGRHQVATGSERRTDVNSLQSH